MVASLSPVNIVSPGFAETLIAFIFACCFISPLHATEVYLDDQNDLNVYLKKKHPANIATQTNLLAFNQLKIKPQYNLASLTRILKIMRNTDNSICVTNKIKTPARQQEFLFSLPVNLYLSRLLYQHKDQPLLSSEVLTPKNELISLTTLLREYPEKSMVIAGSLSYGTFFDQQIANLNPRNKQIIAGSNPYDRAYQMFSLKRSDYILAYPAEIHRHTIEDNKYYQSYKIANAPKYILGHFMCNNTPQSHAFIKRVNTVLIALYQTKEFSQAHTRWLPNTEHELTLNYLDEVTSPFILQQP